MDSKLSLLLLGMLFIIECTSPSIKDKASSDTLSQKIKSEPPAETAEAIANRGAETFVNSPHLTAEQKQKIMVIYIRTYNDAKRIRADIGKSKSLLFNLMATKKNDSKEVEALKRHIIQLDQSRLNIMFTALKEVQAIIGTGKDKEEIWKHFRDFEYPSKMLSDSFNNKKSE